MTDVEKQQDRSEDTHEGTHNANPIPPFEQPVTRATGRSITGLWVVHYRYFALLLAKLYIALTMSPNEISAEQRSTLMEAQVSDSDFPLFVGPMFRLYTPVFPGSRKRTFDAKIHQFQKRTPNILPWNASKTKLKAGTCSWHEDKLEVKVRTKDREDTLHVQEDSFKLTRQP